MRWSVAPAKSATGFNRLEHHDKLVANYEEIAPEVAEAGFKNIICFSGNRDGMADEQGLKNCAIGLKRVMPIARSTRSSS